jgi:hypothetical protein
MEVVEGMSGYDWVWFWIVLLICGPGAVFGANAWILRRQRARLEEMSPEGRKWYSEHGFGQGRWWNL